MGIDPARYYTLAELERMGIPRRRARTEIHANRLHTHHMGGRVWRVLGKEALAWLERTRVPPREMLSLAREPDREIRARVAARLEAERRAGFE